MSENKPPLSSHSCLVGFYRHSKYPNSSSLLLSHLISSYVNICCHSHFILWGNRYRYRYCYRYRWYRYSSHIVFINNAQWRTVTSSLTPELRCRTGGREDRVAMKMSLELAVGVSVELAQHHQVMITPAGMMPRSAMTTFLQCCHQALSFETKTKTIPWRPRLFVWKQVYHIITQMKKYRYYKAYLYSLCKKVEQMSKLASNHTLLLCIGLVL